MSGLNASSPSHGAVNKKVLWNSEMGESNIRRHHTHEQKSIENYEFSALFFFSCAIGTSQPNKSLCARKP
jgi:hypothetical protein